eukprot:TRINITY_DN1187_c0_g2_i3.p1 TRINITY_DN1187_c0_g2~~TRINITY_DN1187_c0_g2_i3.p1  ORF type:complete len:190 (+),score=36.36 TRINITY_DN1187_c0_g2_i3:205-774(+)
MERPAGLEAKTVTLALIGVASLLVLCEIISVATPWYVIYAGGGAATYGLFSFCISIGIVGCGTINTAGGNAAFAFSFIALACYFIALVFWAMYNFFDAPLSKLPGIVKTLLGLILIPTPILSVISWISWVAGFSYPPNITVTGGAGLAFSLICTIVSIVGAVLSWWVRDELGGLGGGSSGGGGDAAPPA